MNAELHPAHLRTLVDVAEQAVRHAVIDRVRWQPELDDFPAELRRPGAAFVTLRRGAHLRGCIGQLRAIEPLVACVADRAAAAALDDPRFPSVSPDELWDLTVEVSVLGESEMLDVSGYDQLLTTVRPGRDGLTVDTGRHHATLLPTVWEQLPDPEEFVEGLWRKAGLGPRAWPSGIRVSRYATQEARA